MNELFGFVLVISLMILIFLGPEYFQSVIRRPHRYRKTGQGRRQALGRN